jgi:hypothetical protein
VIQKAESGELLVARECWRWWKPDNVRLTVTRYYACESLYNIAKVCKGEVLVHFNGIFDALSKVCRAFGVSVHGGATPLIQSFRSPALCRLRSICQERC